MDPPPPSPYDPFLNIIRAQMMDWEPPAPVATYGQEETMRMNAEYHRAHGVPPPKLPKLNMFALDQEGQTQIALALLERLDRDMSTVGPSPSALEGAEAAPRRSRCSGWTDSAKRRRGGRRGASKRCRGARQRQLEQSEQQTGDPWSGVDKTKANAKGLYQGDWHSNLDMSSRPSRGP